jgi:type IV pilus assembly protein PilP
MSKDIGRMNRARNALFFAAAVILALGASAQPPAKPSAQPQAAPAQPAKPPAGPPQPAPAQPAPGATAAAPPLAGGYSYNPQGRRDPFISLIGRGRDSKSSGTRPSGVPGLYINEVNVKGIVKDRVGFAALIQGPDNKTYVVKAGDHLMDGTVKSILQDAVVFSQDVSDPLSLVKQKEIRKSLRSAEGGRG